MHTSLVCGASCTAASSVAARQTDRRGTLAAVGARAGRRGAAARGALARRLSDILRSHTAYRVASGSHFAAATRWRLWLCCRFCGGRRGATVQRRRW